MIQIIQPSRLGGVYHAPPSKSDSHRALICAAASDGFSLVSPLDASDDIRATLEAVEMLGAKIQFANGKAMVQGIAEPPSGCVRVYCNESGSTLRFLIPLAAALGIESVFTGSGKLPQRPLQAYNELFPGRGVTMLRMEDDQLPLKVCGKLQPGQFALPGNVSSQFVSGLLLSLPLLDADSEIRLTSPLESRPYVDLTVSTLNRFGVRIQETEQGYLVPGRQAFTACTYHVEGDYSNAAFFAAAGLMGDGIELNGLSPESLQGDRAILPLLEQFGASVKPTDTGVRIAPGTLRGISIDVQQIPDLVPVLAVIGAYAPGTTYLYNAHRLRWKESNRLESVTELLSRLGAEIECDGDSITIHGGKRLRGGVVSACNDHRIAMSASIAALFCDAEVYLDGAECVAKSYPGFYEDYNRLGGKANVDLG